MCHRCEDDDENNNDDDIDNDDEASSVANTIQYRHEYYHSGINSVEFRG